MSNDPTTQAVRHVIDAVRKVGSVVGLNHRTAYEKKVLAEAGLELYAAGALIEGDPESSAPSVVISDETMLLVIDLDEVTRSQRPVRCSVAECIAENDLSDEDATELRIALIEKGYADVGGGAAPAYRIEVEGCAFATADDDPSSTTRPDLQPAPDVPAVVLDPNSLSHSQNESEMAGDTLAQAVSPVPFADQSAGEGE